MLYTLPNELIVLILSYLDNESLLSIYNVTNDIIIYRIIHDRLENINIKHEDIIRFNNRSLIELLLHYNDNYNKLMTYASKYNHKDLVDFFISKGANDWNWSVIYAAENNHKDLVDFFISKGADNWEWIINYAAFNNHRDLVDLFISKGIYYDWNDAMIYAAQNNNKDLVDLFISKGADEWYAAINRAIRNNHIELAEYLKQKRDNR